MKVLVTGATGFLGSNLAHHLVARGDTVRILKRARSSLALLEGLPVEAATGDVTDLDSLVEAARGVEGIYHVAGLISYWKPKRAWQYKVNVEGVRNVMDAAVKNGVRRVVHTSSISAVGYRADGRPSDETVAWNWERLDSGYMTTKHLGEDEALRGPARGVEVVVVNPALIIGPRDINWSSGRMFKIVSQRNGLAIPDGANTTCDVDDVCRGHIAAMERGRSGERYILGGEYWRYPDLFRAIAEVMGRPFRVRILPRWIPMVAAYGLYGLSLVTRQEPPITPELLRVASHSRHYLSDKAIRELGYPQTPLRTTLEKTYRWYKENGYLP